MKNAIRQAVELFEAFREKKPRNDSDDIAPQSKPNIELSDDIPF